MDDYINKFRFLVPPTVFLCFMFLFNPNLLGYLSLVLFFDLGGIFLAFFGSATLLLTIGFIISSLGAFFINICEWTLSPFDKENINWGRSAAFNNDFYDRIALQELRDWENTENQGEYIKHKVEKRWQIFTVNLNVCISLASAIVFSLLSEFKENRTILILSFLLFLSFCYNCYRSHRSVKIITQNLS